ncbi:MAG TPA: 16S rRNA (adenine(1518)-N(6)/adenine(1519)-N(6))-dimethyltransferase RsmA [Candidatus Paceibacterota bacterium]
MHKKKSLAQHFLRDPRILQKIADAARLAPEDAVLEVGPGEGTLTELLLQRAGHIVAVEKDARLIPALQERFAKEISAQKLELVHDDILKFDTKRFTLHATRYKIVANLPYYITGQFLRKFLQETKRQPASMTLLLQKEVARRIVAADKRESVLSISVKCYGTPRYIATVKAGSFSPPPKVASAILTIENISKSFFANAVVKPLKITRSDLVKKEGEFFALLKKGFAHPRKLLSSNLGVPPSVLQECGIAPHARAENVSLAQWQCLLER